MPATLEDQILQDRMTGQFLVYETEIAAGLGKAFSLKDRPVADIIEARVSGHCFCSSIRKTVSRDAVSNKCGYLRPYWGRFLSLNPRAALYQSFIGKATRKTS
jgi:hypothetical protein